MVAELTDERAVEAEAGLGKPARPSAIPRLSARAKLIVISRPFQAMKLVQSDSAQPLPLLTVRVLGR